MIGMGKQKGRSWVDVWKSRATAHDALWRGRSLSANIGHLSETTFYWLL